MTAVSALLACADPAGDLDAAIDAACDQACAAIAPAWPLDQAIAVNPHWHRIGQRVPAVAARLGVLAGLRVLPERAQVRAAWERGSITAAALDTACRHAPAGWTPERCLDALARPLRLPRLPLLIDVLDQGLRPAHLPWPEAVTHQISQTCAAWFDRHQADWQPARTTSLYGFWRDTLQHDHGIGVLMGLPQLGRSLAALPATARDAERWAMKQLGLPRAVWTDYLEAVLLTVQGWASACAWRRWQARLAGADDGHLRELLTIRLAWGAVLLEAAGDTAAHGFARLRQAWSQLPTLYAQAEAMLVPDAIWQQAWDEAYQRGLAARLAWSAGAPALRPPPEVQFACCMDVRSEPLRRALEDTWPAIETLGVAGFFGLPAAYRPAGTSARWPQLPGLLLPTLEITDVVQGARPARATADAAADARAHRGPADPLAAARRRSDTLGAGWRAAMRWPHSAFACVEMAGAAALGTLLQAWRPRPRARTAPAQDGLPQRYRTLSRPALSGLDLAARIQLAAQLVRMLGVARRCASLVVLAGHGSQSVNNAHAATLECGACGGHAGDVNVRAAARLLNEPAIRAGLSAYGITLPATAWFVAAVHNTTTDEVTGYDLDLLPPAARLAWSRLQTVLAQAGDQVRRQRAASLGLDPAAPAPALLRQLRRRASDPAATRPEWGLAGNAALLIAPRDRSRGCVLDGRVFLHEYAPAEDPDGSVLEQLMVAPLVVAHWINWQYHASTCEPERLGSGNKLLHNVVGGHLGVFEGNGGDLRIGLPRQCLHDGTSWRHEPVRLTAVIDAPAARIETVLARHPTLAQLVGNGWLHLWRFSGSGLQRYRDGAWEGVSPPLGSTHRPAQAA